MKKFCALICLLAVCLCVSVNAQEIKAVSVNLNGKIVNCASYGQAATIVDGRTMVPLRAIFESLGADVIWDSTSRTVHSALGGNVVSLTVGEAEIIKNGEKSELDVPAMIMNNRTLVPARAVAEAFGVAVEWDKDTRTVLMTTVDTSREIERTGKIQSPNDEKHAYGKFYFGMTMQECWDAVGDGEAQKRILSNADGINELCVMPRQNGAQETPGLRLLFTDNYLFSVSLSLDDETENTCFSDEYVLLLLYGYAVPDEARQAVGGFLEAFCSLDTRALSPLCTSQNSVRRLGVETAEDALVYTGFDRQRLEEKLTVGAFGGKEEYAPLATAIVNAVEGAAVKVLGECGFGIESINAVSENEVFAKFYLTLPDLSFILNSASTDFEKALYKALEAGGDAEKVSFSGLSDKEIALALSPELEKTLTELYLSYFDACPVVRISSGQELCAVLYDGQWTVRADGEFVKALLCSLAIFE